MIALAIILRECDAARVSPSMYNRWHKIPRDSNSILIKFYGIRIRVLNKFVRQKQRTGNHKE